LWWPQSDERHANRELLCWSGMTDIEHSTTSGSNEVVVDYCFRGAINVIVVT